MMKDMMQQAPDGTPDPKKLPASPEPRASRDINAVFGPRGQLTYRAA
jgi:hypothetical protein